MKKFLFLSFILTTIPAFATCPIDNLSSACSIAELQKNMDTTYSKKPIVQEFAGSPEARLKPSNNEADEKMLREFGPKSPDYSYNADCQFGVCYDKGAPPTFKQQKQ